MLILLTECRHALRDILARPAFSALVTTVLAAGLACVVFMLAILDGFMLRPLPFAAPDELYQAGFLGDGGLGDVFPVTDQDVIGIRRSLADVADVAAAARSTMNLGDLDRPQRVNGARVSANLFRTLGVAPLLGREFSENDETPGTPATAMLSYELWQRRYGADPDIVGRSIRLDAHPAVVAGVMPKDFSYPRREVIWQPATLAPSVARDEYSYWVVLRRHAGVGAARVRAAFETWFADAARAEPERFRGLHPQMEPLAAMVMDRTTRAMLGSMLAAVFMVLLIACANAANLLSTHTLARRGELALRVALGASRTRLVMQVFAQSLLLSLAALALALAAAHAALAWQEASMRDSEFTLLWLHFGIGGRVLAMAVAATLLTALASCVVPALQASRTALAPTLAEGGARSAGDAGFARISRMLVVGEVALSCALVICVGTLARGIAALERADIGIDTTHLLTARVLLPASTYQSAADQARLYERLGDRLRRDPEVLDASVGTALPGSYYNEMREILPEAAMPGNSALPQTAYAAVDDHFPAAWGVALRDGRFFDSRDGADGAHVAVVDRRFAERYGDGAGVIGKRFRIDPRDPAGATVTIVGVIEPVVLDAPGGVPPPSLLVPLRQAPFKIASIGVRTRGDALAYAPRLSAAMKDIDADTPLYWIRDYAAISRAMSFGERTIAHSFAAFGAIALLLAAAGLYGVMAFAVGRRTREIGVRRALGAPRRRVLRSLFARTFAQLALGLMLGITAGVPFAHMLSASLRTIEPGGAPAVFAALLVLGAAAALAALVPARRALRVDPAVALRHE